MAKKAYIDKVGQASDCQGKQQFPSKQAIFRIFTRPGRERPQAYKCRQCGHYHVAHGIKNVGNRKSLGRYLAQRKKYYADKVAALPSMPPPEKSNA